MKILQVNNSYEKKGGAEAVFLNTIQLLRSKGIDVSVFSRKSENSKDEPYEKYFLPEKNDSLSNKKIIDRFYSRQSAKLLNQLLDNEKPDIAHIHNIHGEITFSILPLLKKRKIPVVASIHGFKYLCPAWVFINGKGEICEKCKNGKYYNCFFSNCSQEGVMKSVLLSAESYVRDLFLHYNKYIDKYLFVSNFTQSKFLEFNPSIKSKSFQLYNFAEKFDTSSKGKHNNYFLYLGRLAHEKGITTLISAFMNSTDQKLLIAGSGPLQDYVMSNSGSNIEYLGYKSGAELENLIMNAYFVILPTETYENNPMTIVEAYSKGKSVIGTDLGGISEIVKNGENGFLFKPKNSDQLSEIVNLSAAMSESEYSKMSENAFMFAKKNFDPSDHYKKLQGIYNELIK